MSSIQTSCAMSPELLRALDGEAYSHDETRAATIRRILAAYLREAGRLGLAEPPLFQLGAHNDRYRTGGRP